MYMAERVRSISAYPILEGMMVSLNKDVHVISTYTYTPEQAHCSQTARHKSCVTLKTTKPKSQRLNL